jgi:hypothetical protein
MLILLGIGSSLSSCGLKSLPANYPGEPALDTYLHQLSPTLVPDEPRPTPDRPSPTPVEVFSQENLS